MGGWPETATYVYRAACRDHALPPPGGRIMKRSMLVVGVLQSAWSSAPAVRTATPAFPDKPTPASEGQEAPALNQDGAGPTDLDSPQPMPNADVNGNSGKDLFIYIRENEDRSEPDHKLNLVELPEGIVYNCITLSEPDWIQKKFPDSDEENHLYQSDVMQSILESGSLVCSPDSRFLASIGATADPGGDIWGSEDRSTTRSTTGSGQATLPDP